MTPVVAVNLSPVQFKNQKLLSTVVPPSPIAACRRIASNWK